jgi:hypothetical protein
VKPHVWKVVRAFVAETPRGRVLLGTTVARCCVCEHSHVYKADGTLTVEDVEKRGFENFHEPDCDAELTKKVMSY